MLEQQQPGSYSYARVLSIILSFSSLLVRLHPYRIRSTGGSFWVFVCVFVLLRLGLSTEALPLCALQEGRDEGRIHSREEIIHAQGAHTRN